MSITINTTTMSTRTTSAHKNWVESVNVLQTALDKNVKHDKVVAAQVSANKCLTALNKSVMVDANDAILTASDPLTALCKVGVYDAHAVTVKTGVSPVYKTVKTPLSLSAFIAQGNAQGKLSVSGDWYALAVCAVKVAAVCVAGEMEIAPETYATRLRLSDREMEIVRRDFSGISASRTDVRTALQAAINALFGMTEQGKPRFFATKGDARAVMQMFAWNNANNALVVPQEDTMVAFFFNALRHIVGEHPYEIEVKENKKTEKKAQ